MGNPRTKVPATDAMVDRIEAWPFTHRGRPAMALVLPALDRTDRPFPVVMVEDGIGHPLAGLVDARAMVLGQMGEAPITGSRSASFELAMSWLDGTMAWSLHRQHFGAGGGVPGRSRAKVMARTRAVVAKAMEASGFSDAFKDALAAMSGWRSLPSPDPVGLFEPGEPGDALRDFARGNPFLSNLGYQRAAKAARTGRIDCRSIHPNLSPARSRSLRSPAWSDPSVADAVRDIILDCHDPRAFLDLVGGVPPEWLPTDAEGIRSLSRVLAISGELLWCGADPMALARGSKGCWRELVRRCEEANRLIWPIGTIEPHKLNDYMADPLSDLTNRVVAPGLALEFGPDDAVGLDHSIARRLLYRDKSLPACIEAAKRWHDALPVIEAAMPDPVGDPGWEPLFDTVARGGVLLVPLTTSVSVREEGARGADSCGMEGLDHCVSSYLPQARTGHVHLVSVRRPLPGGGYVRLATAELRQDPDGHVRLVQLQGRRNGEPAREARDAVNALLCERPRFPRVEPRVTGSGDAVADACGYDWTDRAAWTRACTAYAPVLPRDMRGDPASVQAEILRMARGAP